MKYVLRINKKLLFQLVLKNLVFENKVLAIVDGVGMVLKN
jgi:hypothetical protein